MGMDMVWEEPPARQGKNLLPYDEVVKELKKNVGTWAKFGPFEKLAVSTVARTLKGKGCQVSTRKTPKGYWAYARWPEIAKAT